MHSPRLAAFSVVAVAATLAFASGGGHADQLARGRKLFQTGSYPSCGFCHAMRSAVMTSPFADDLDGSLVEDTKGMSKAQLESYILRTIKNAACYDPHDVGRCMPRLLFTGKDAQAVAVFVATCGGHVHRPGCAPVPAFSKQAQAGLHDFQTLGCPSCHIANLTVSIAPPLDSVYGSRVRLQSGKTVVANASYLVASILTPNRDTVKGYPHGLMASRIRPGDVSAAQAKAIVAYLRELR